MFVPDCAVLFWHNRGQMFFVSFERHYVKLLSMDIDMTSTPSMEIGHAEAQRGCLLLPHMNCYSTTKSCCEDNPCDGHIRFVCKESTVDKIRSLGSWGWLFFCLKCLRGSHCNIAVQRTLSDLDDESQDLRRMFKDKKNKGLVAARTIS